jgi:8-oxo-dGTP pyrophosphatase MutT (NUDIX family)
VLPKGHLEPGEQASQAAVREVREETGVWASVRGGLPPLLFLTGGEYVAAQLFLMEACAESRPSEARQHRWLALDAAAALASHPETQQALRAAEERRAALMTAPRR